MLYQGETLQLHWLDNGIAELVFNASGSVNKLDTRTVASWAKRSPCWKTNLN